MALVLNYSVQKYLTDCKKLLITDNTGNYNTNNTTGWETPNLAKADVALSELEITLPDGTVETPIDLLVAPYLFPQTNSTAYLIRVDSMVDGVYKFDFTIEDALAVTYTDSVYYLSTCNIDCCMAKYSTKVQGCCGNCDNILDKWSEMREYYDAILWQFECGNYDSATDLLAKLTKLCSSTNCGC